MRTVAATGGRIELCGGALNALAWHRAFGGDGLYEALASVEKGLACDPPDVRLYDVLRLAWCQAFTAAYAGGRDLPPFEQWCSSIGKFSTVELGLAVVSEARDGIFHDFAGPVGGQDGGGRLADVGEAPRDGSEDGPVGEGPRPAHGRRRGRAGDRVGGPEGQ
jgi:hypothetical protein